MSLTWRSQPGVFPTLFILLCAGLALLCLMALPATSAQVPDLINVDVLIAAVDDDALVNDVVLVAHQEDRNISQVEIRLFVNDLQVDAAVTDGEGVVRFANLTDDNYTWEAHHQGEAMVYEGGFFHLNVSLDRGSTSYVSDFNGDDEHDDFYAQVSNGSGDGQANGFVEIYNETMALVASGDTDLSFGPYQNVFFAMDLPAANYTFSIWMDQGGQLLQNGSFTTHPAPPDTGSNEWFVDLYYHYEDRDHDGLDDWIIVHYDVDTADPQMEVNVTWVIESSGGVEMLNVTDAFIAPNGTVDHRNLSWLCTAGDDYTAWIFLFDENNSLEDWAWSLVTLDLFSLPPQANFTGPQPGSMVWGVVNLTGTASDPEDDENLELVEVRYEGGDWAPALPLAGDWSNWYYLWDTGSLPEGQYDLEARAYDGDNHSLPATLTLEINHNDPPAVTVDYPEEGAQVRGYITLRGHALDPDGPANLSAVHISLDDLGFDQPWIATGTSSWNLVWNTSHASSGDHTLYFRARDHGGLFSPIEQVNLTLMANQAPSIEVLTPETLVKPDRWLVDLAWEAQDPEGDDLTVSLSVEPVAAPEQRVTIATGLPATGTHTWNCSGFETGLYRIWGRVTDSFGDHDQDSPAGKVDVPKVLVYFLTPAPTGDIADLVYRVRWVVDGYSGSRTTDVFLDNDTDPDNGGTLTLANLQKHTSYQWDTADLAEGTYYLRLNVTVDVLFLVSVVSGPVEVIHQDQPQRMANLTLTPDQIGEGVNVLISVEITNPGSGNQRMNITYVMDNYLLANHDFFIYSKEMELDYLYWIATPGEHTLQVRVYRWHHDEFDQEFELTFVVEGTAASVETDDDRSPWPMIIIVILTLFILGGALLLTGLIPAREILDRTRGGGKGTTSASRSSASPESPGRSTGSYPPSPSSSSTPSPSPSYPGSTASSLPRTTSSASSSASMAPSPRPVDTSVEFGDESEITGTLDTEIEFEDESSQEVEFDDEPPPESHKDPAFEAEDEPPVGSREVVDKKVPEPPGEEMQEEAGIEDRPDGGPREVKEPSPSPRSGGQDDPSPSADAPASEAPETVTGDGPEVKSSEEGPPDTIAAPASDPSSAPEPTVDASDPAEPDARPRKSPDPTEGD